jgi:hypothetical protein
MFPNSPMLIHKKSCRAGSFSTIQSKIRKQSREIAKQKLCYGLLIIRGKINKVLMGDTHAHVSVVAFHITTTGSGTTGDRKNKSK